MCLGCFSWPNDMDTCPHQKIDVLITTDLASGTSGLPASTDTDRQGPYRWSDPGRLSRHTLHGTRCGEVSCSAGPVRRAGSLLHVQEFTPRQMPQTKGCAECLPSSSLNTQQGSSEDPSLTQEVKAGKHFQRHC